MLVDMFWKKYYHNNAQQMIKNIPSNVSIGQRKSTSKRDVDQFVWLSYSL